MRETIRVELHCHSTCSDGSLPPEQIATKLAGAGVIYAALTDHDSLAGQVPFRNACARLGIGCISGIEITTEYNEKIVHILGYGLPLDNNELQSILSAQNSLRNGTSPDIVVHRLSSAEGIALIHKANGIAILAHPHITEPDFFKLSRMIEELRKDGLDGIETLRPDIPHSDQPKLSEMAKSNELLTSAGSDDHFLPTSHFTEPGIEMPIGAWKQFRNALIDASARLTKQNTPGEEVSFRSDRKPSSIHWQSFAMQIVLPAILALLLFAGVIIFAVLPTFEQALLDRKREMIRELTNTAWSILAEAAQEETNGLLTSDQARSQAIIRVEAMRYGREGKDYFWIQDTTPKMVMHPFRKDLNGTDLSKFVDPSGAHIFDFFAKLVKEKKEGYVKYVWQWKDDPSRLEPKESYIRFFETWGWIIGTGIYTHDVKQELNRLEFKLALFSSAIFILVIFLLIYLIRASLRIERKRTVAEELLQETTQRYKTLVDASTEGMLLMSCFRCKYGNPMALELLGYSQNELSLIDITDIIPEISENAAIHDLISSLHNGFPERPLQGIVCRRDGTRLECAITIQSTGHALSDGYLLLLRRVSSLDSGIAVATRSLLGKLLKLPLSIAQDIREEIDKATTEEEITAICLSAPKLVQSLLDNGGSAAEIARMLSSVTDAATRGFLRIGIQIYGEPPLPFTFIALGSQGRMEQTLFTDQDNAVIYAPLQGANQKDVDSYFEKLTNFVCSGLINSGYHSCKGKVMANNSRWCQSIDIWKEYFNTWITCADLQELMEFSVFFDFRAVFGEETLVRDLRKHVLYRVQNSPRFFPQVALNALQFKSPMRLFGIVVNSPGKGESSHHFDLKAAVMPIVSFARLYSLQQGIHETNTSARIDELVRKGFMLPSRQDELMTAYMLLLRLRLRTQAAIMQADGQPDNLIDTNTLGHIEKAILRECFNEIDHLQQKIRIDFLGGT